MDSPDVTLLVVEDDLSLRALHARSFEAARVQVLTAAGLLDARGILRTTTPDAVLLDIGLEDDSGLELLAELPEEMVVVVVTGRRGKDLVREVLAAGADDVVFKPFQVDELTSRVLGRLEARVRRAADAAGATQRACPALYPATSRLYCRRREEIRHVSQRELSTLRLLLEADGEVVSRETLSLEVHDAPRHEDSRRVDALVSRLRRKLACADCRIEASLTTVHGRGYRFAEPARIDVLDEPPTS